MYDSRNPCTKHCPDRPNCKGCVRGNEYRKQRHKELDEEYSKRAFRRYEAERRASKQEKAIKDSQKPKRLIYHK